MNGEYSRRRQGQGENKQRNNFRTSVAYVVLLIIVVATVLYAFYYSAFSRFARSQAIRSNKNITDSLGYSITEMNSSIRSLCASQFSLGDVQYLMHLDHPEPLEVSRVVTRLQHSISSNLYLHSILTYNNHTNEVYSTYRGLTDIDTEIKDIMQRPDTKQLTPIPRVLNKNDYYIAQPVFSYIMYDTYNGEEINCALVVNVKAEWLADSLKRIAPKQGRLVVFDGSMNQLATSDTPVVSFSGQAPAYCADLMERLTGQVLDINGTKTFASVSEIEGTGWYLLSETPYEVIMQESRGLEQQLLIFSVLIFCAAIIAAVLVVHKIYKPIKRIAHTLQAQQLVPESLSRVDDVAYISQALRLVEQRYRDMEKTTTDIIRENLLRTLLLGVSTSSSDTLEIHQNTLSLQRQLSDCTMAYLRVDGAAKLATLPLEQRKQLNETIVAIARTAMPGCIKNGVTDVAPGDFVLLLNSDAGLPAAFAQLQVQIQEQCGLSVSVFWERTRLSQKLQFRFAQLQRISRYRMFAGPGCCLDERILEQFESLPLYYPEDTIQAIKSAIKRRDLEESRRLYARFSQDIQQNNNFENYRFCVMQLFFNLQTLLEELNGYATANIQIDMDEVYSSINHAEHSGQIHAVFDPLFLELCTSEQNLAGRHSVLLESVKEYIDIHYANNDLSLKQIASDFSLSQSYLGKLFREHYDCSIKDYITQVRLRVAAENLLQSSLSIKKIMELSGFDNESNFYRIFRACYGVTPSSYRMSHSIAKAAQSPDAAGL